MQVGCESETAGTRDHGNQVELTEFFLCRDQKAGKRLLNVRKMTLVIREEHFVLLV